MSFCYTASPCFRFLFFSLIVANIVTLSFSLMMTSVGNINSKVADGTAAKPLPDKLLVGYTANNCQDLNEMSKVTRAVQEGVNVLIWTFLKIAPEAAADKCDETSSSSTTTKRPCVVVGGPNRINFELYKQQLVAFGYSDVIHLISFGGWNGPHFPPGYDGQKLFDSWVDWNTSPSNCDLFDGIDWDLEGEDNVQGPNNLFTRECLEQMGEFTRLAKTHGYIVGMAPAESYLDIFNSRFSRYVNLTYPEDAPWRQDFTYHGWSVYAYILAKWGEYVDFISIQFYESYSHAAYEITQRGMTPHDFLVRFVDQLVMSEPEGGYHVNFEQDTACDLKNQFVSVPLKKLVFGFANGWTNSKDEKAIFFPPSEVKIAYNTLYAVGRAPRGFMFWLIEEEGNGGVYLTPGLNDILHIRAA